MPPVRPTRYLAGTRATCGDGSDLRVPVCASPQKREGGDRLKKRARRKVLIISRAWAVAAAYECGKR